MGGSGQVIPSLLLRFDDVAEREPTVFLGDGNDDPLTCDSVSTCPTLTDGLNGLGASFDGVNDYIPLHIGSNLHDQSITLDIKLDQLPSAGNVAQLLSTDSSAARASQIYINSAGNIVAATRTPAISASRAISAYGRTCRYFTPVKQAGAPGATGPNSRSTGQVNGFDRSYNCPRADCTNVTTQFGPGRIGNDLAGSSPLDATIDNLSINGIGTYTFDIPLSAEIALINEITDARAAFCADFESCPTLTDAGAFGAALSFDGDDDYLSMSGVNFLQSDYTVGAWFKTASADAVTILAGADPDDGDLRFVLLTNGSGQIVLLQTNSLGNLGVRIGPPSVILNDGEWHYVTAVREDGANTLYIDGAVVATGNLGRRPRSAAERRNHRSPTRG